MRGVVISGLGILVAFGVFVQFAKSPSNANNLFFATAHTINGGVHALEGVARG